MEGSEARGQVGKALAIRDTPDVDVMKNHSRRTGAESLGGWGSRPVEQNHAGEGSQEMRANIV